MRRAGAPADTRTPYVIDEDAADRAVVAVACRSIMDALEGVAVSAYVDCVSDLSDEMPPEIRAVEDELGAANPSGIDVTVERADAARWELVRAYASWSIYTNLVDARGRPLASFSDSGSSLVAELTTAEADDLMRRLHGVARVRLLSEFHAERHQKRRDQRRARLRQLLRLDR